MIPERQQSLVRQTSERDTIVRLHMYNDFDFALRVLCAPGVEAAGGGGGAGSSNRVGVECALVICITRRNEKMTLNLGVAVPVRRAT